MGFRRRHRISSLAISLPTLTVALAAGALGLTTAPASAATGSSCPAANSIKNRLPASNVAAAYAINASNTKATYTFNSLMDESPSNGVPGLMGYCVYTALPNGGTATATGANGTSWSYGTGRDGFRFIRPGGEPSNIPLNGGASTLGTATWTGGVPATQAIILHINDPVECGSLYGAAAKTCFVRS